METPQESFQLYSLERRVVRDGRFPRSNRVEFLQELVGDQHRQNIRAWQNIVDAHDGTRGGGAAGRQAAGAESKIAAWRAIVLEYVISVVLETELEECVVLLESLKFWRQLAQMQVSVGRNTRGDDAGDHC